MLGSFLDQDDIKVAEKLAKYILIIFSLFYFTQAAFMFLLDHTYPSSVNLFITLIYIYVLTRVKKLNINNLAYAVHLVCSIYSTFMVLYFGWNFGAQYFLIPCIAFCYVGQFENKKIIYALAILECLLFEFLYYFMEVKGYSLSNKLVLSGYNLNDFFYILHSFIACATIIIMMYFLKIKVYKTVEVKESINEILSVSASTDPLTHLLNRWAFMEKIHSITKSTNFHFALIDIDYFKKVNDTYGHSVGDEVLRITSSCIKTNFSKYTDMIARWGGEEFLILALDCDEKDFYETCNKFKNDLKNSKFCIDEISVSASVGCLHVNKEFLYGNFDSYIKQVDELLYKAKDSGRNTIECKSI